MKLNYPRPEAIVWGYWDAVLSIEEDATRLPVETMEDLCDL